MWKAWPNMWLSRQFCRLIQRISRQKPQMFNKITPDLWRPAGRKPRCPDRRPGRNESEARQPNKVLRKLRQKIHEKDWCHKIGAIVVAALLSPYTVGGADAAGPLQEGPLHWTARHVRQAAVETGDTLSTPLTRGNSDCQESFVRVALSP